MQIPVLIESIEGQRFRARTGEPLGLTAEGESCAEATHALEQLIAERLAKGVWLGWLNIPNATTPAHSSLPFPADDRYQTDLSYGELQQIMADFRRAEDEQERRCQESTGP